MSNVTKTRLLLAAPTSLMGSSLRTYLATVSEIELVGSVTMLENIVCNLQACQAHVLLLDAGMFSGSLRFFMESFLSEVNQALPCVKSIVLVDSLAQQRAVLRAKNTQVLLKGELGDRLREAILSNLTHSVAR